MQEEGYLFVPDGSGAIMEFNNEKNRYRQYQAQVYGYNATTTDAAATVSEQAMMPIFGINKQDNGMLAVITEGETSCVINACISKKGSSYNYAYASATIRDYKSIYMARYNGAYGKEGNKVDLIEKPVIGDRLSIQYFFLEEGKAQYTDMALCYRDYLQENGGLKKSDLAGKNYMILDLYGAVSIKQYVFSVDQASVRIALITAICHAAIIP
jgi:hypothetical protein